MLRFATQLKTESLVIKRRHRPFDTDSNKTLDHLHRLFHAGDHQLNFFFCPFAQDVFRLVSAREIIPDAYPQPGKNIGV